MLRLNIYGGFRAEDGLGNEIPVKSKKARALLAYLALPPGKARSREKLMALLWSDRGDEQARGSLRQALSGLRRELGDKVGKALVIAEDTVSLDPDLVIVTNREEDDDLLEGLHINDPAFDEWLRDERLRHVEAPSIAKHLRKPTVSPDKPSIAVLPFVNKSGDPEQEYFADGITEDIIIELSRFNSLFVIAPNSSFHYKDQSPNVQDVGSELGVSYVVEGSVRRAGQRVRITTQLVDAGTGSHLWAERYDRDLEDIFAVQDEVVSNIVMMVPGRVEVADRIKSERKPASDISAYDLVLRSNWLTFNEHNPSEALSLLEKAIEIDPSFARAHARLAQHTAWGVFVRGDALETAKRQTREHGKRATRLAPGDAEVHGILAEAYGMVGEHELSAHHADQAISLNPNAYHVMVFVAWAWATLGNTGDAISLFEKAMRTDPYSNIGLRENKVDMYYIARRYDECAAQHIGWPNPPLHTEVAIAAALAQLGREDDAKTMLSRIELELAEGQEIKKICRAYQNMCAKSEDGEHWLEGFRKAGIDI